MSAVSLAFADGVAEIKSLASMFPDISGSAVTLAVESGTLPAGVRLDPVGRRLIYDGTAGTSSVNVTISALPTAPSLTLSNASGVVPVMAGIVFPQGAVNGPLGASDAGLRVVVKRTWNDGSVKHAVVCGLVDAAQRITFNTAPIAGTALVAADIQTAAPTAVVDLGVLGSVSLASLLATPSETWISTEKMVECHYRGQFGTTDVWVEFHVRLWSNGKMWIRAVVENSNRILANGVNQSLTGTVTIDGVVVTTYSSTLLYRNTQHIHERWVGATQYDVVVNHDVRQITRTKLVPNYGMSSSISDSALNALPTTYAIGSRLLFQQDMGDTGFQLGIGLLPNWDAMYIVSGDYRAWKSVLAHGKACFNYPILWREGSRMLCPTDHPNDNYGGTGHGGGAGFTAGVLRWESAHHPSMGYLSYMLTGDALYADALLGLAATHFQNINTAYGGSGTLRLNYNQQTRDTAWFQRTLGQVSAIIPDDAQELAPIREWLANQINYFSTISLENSAAVNSQLGYPQTISTYNPASPLTVAPWMHNFWIAAMGYVSEIDAVTGSNLPKFEALRNWMYRGIVGLLGDGSGYCYANASRYTICVSNETVPNYAVRNAADIYQTWAEVFSATMGSASCATAMGGTGAEAPEGAYAGYWGNLLPAISYAVDHQAPGADAAYGRMTSATNWSALASSGSNWSSTPVWGCSPRTDLPKTQSIVHVDVVQSNDFFASENVPGSYDSSTFTWTPGRNASGVITAASYNLVPIGPWVEIAGTAFTTNVQPLLTAALPTYNDPGSSDLADILNNYGGFAHDVSGGRVFAHGGGHQGSANNGVYRCDLKKFQWAIAKLPDMQTYWPANYKTNPPRDNSYTVYTNAKDAVAADPTTSAFYTDEFYDPIQPLASTRNPTSRHTYEAMTFYNGKLRHGIRRYWEWDEATGNWTSRFPLGKNATTHTQSGGGYAGEAVKGTWDEVNSRYICTPSFVGAPGAGWAWNESTQTWSNPSGLLGGWEAYGAVFARRGREWCSFTKPTRQGTYWPPTLKSWNLDTGIRTPITLAGMVQSKCPDDVNGGEATIMAYVESQNKFFLATPYDLNDTYANTANLPLEAFLIDSVAGTITHEVQTGKWPVLTTVSLVKNKLFYIPQIKALVMFKDATTNAIIRRFP